MKRLGTESPTVESEQLLANLLRMINREHPISVLLYSPIGWEPDPRDLMNMTPAHSFLFPKVAGEQLTIHRLIQRSRWITGPYGISEPDPASWEPANISNVDLAVVPGLAFSPGGARLGRGRGFYDRLLGHPDFHGIKTGLAWDWQMVDEVPCDCHDIFMDFVVTQSGIHEAGRTLDKPMESE